MRPLDPIDFDDSRCRYPDFAREVDAYIRQNNLDMKQLAWQMGISPEVARQYRRGHLIPAIGTLQHFRRNTGVDWCDYRKQVKRKQMGRPAGSKSGVEISNLNITPQGDVSRISIDVPTKQVSKVLKLLGC